MQFVFCKNFTAFVKLPSGLLVTGESNAGQGIAADLHNRFDLFFSFKMQVLGYFILLYAELLLQYLYTKDFADLKKNNSFANFALPGRLEDKACFQIFKKNDT